MASDPLFSHIEQMQQTQLEDTESWGEILDAGTGWASLNWVLTLPTKAWTAVTVDSRRTSKMLPALQGSIRECDRLLLGDWQEPTLLEGEVFDVVLLDYLIGAIDAFTPYFQEQMFKRIKPHVGGRLYLIGLEPVLSPPKERDKRLLFELDSLKDACRIHANLRPYREFPAEWIVSRCEEAGFRVVEVKHFPRTLREKYVTSRATACRQLLPDVSDLVLREGLSRRINSLEETLMPYAKSTSGIRLSSNYVLTAEPL